MIVIISAVTEILKRIVYKCKGERWVSSGFERHQEAGGVHAGPLEMGRLSVREWLCWAKSIIVGKRNNRKGSKLRD